MTYHTGVAKGDASQSDPRVSVSLASPPTLGKEPVYPQKSNATATVVFTLKRDDAPRFRQALASRGMVSVQTYRSPVKIHTLAQGGLLKVHKNGKLSILENPANLEIDLAGALVGNQGVRFDMAYSSHRAHDCPTSLRNASITCHNVSQRSTLSSCLTVCLTL